MRIRDNQAIVVPDRACTQAAIPSHNADDTIPRFSGDLRHFLTEEA
jgi:hypothetical protein